MTSLTPELKAYLDEWRAEIKLMRDKLCDDLRRPLTGLAAPPPPAPATTTPLVVAPTVPINNRAVVTTPCVTAPGASSDKADIDLASAGLAEPAALVSAIWEPLAVAPAAPSHTIAGLPATCSTDCAAHDVTESTTTTLLPWTKLAPNNDDVEHGASLSSVSAVLFYVAPATSLTAVIHEDLTPSTKLVVSASTTPTFPVSIGDISIITNSSIKGVPPAMEDALQSDQVPAVQAIESQLIFADHVIDTPLYSSWHHEQMHCPKQWPPPYLYLRWCDSSKPRPIPWPSFAVLPGGVHLTEPRPPLQGTSGELSVDVPVVHHLLHSQYWVIPLHICLQYEPHREKNFTSVQHNDQEDQFNFLDVSLNVLENFLRKPCGEPKEATVSDLISKDASVFRLCHIPWFSFHVLELNSQESYYLALFQWEIAWQPEVEGECFDIAVYYCHGNSFEDCPSTYMAMVMLLYRNYSHLKYNHHICCGYKPWSPLTRMVYIYGLLQEQVSVGVNVLEMQCLRYMFLVRLAVTTYRRGGPMELPDVSAPVVTKYQQPNLLYYCQTSKLRSIPVLELQSTGNLIPPGTCQASKVQSYMKFIFSDCYGEGIDFKVGHLFYHVVHHSTQGAFRCGVTFFSHFHMYMGMRNGELLQWLANNLCGSDVSIIQSPQDADQFWVLVNLDGEANQHMKNQWYPRSCTIALCSSEKRWTTPLHYHAHLKWSPLHLAGAFLIWLVAWTVDGLEFSMGQGQSPSRGERNVIRAAFHEHIQVSPNYCIDIIYYHGDYQHDPSKTKKVHVPWDPGKSGLRYHRKLRLGDKPNFKEGGMLGTYSTGLLGWPPRPPWARPDTDPQVLHMHERRQHSGYPEGSDGNGGGFFFHLGSNSPSSSCLFLCVASEFLYL